MVKVRVCQVHAWVTLDKENVLVFDQSQILDQLPSLVVDVVQLT